MATENKNEVLEQVEQIRKMLDTYDELFCSVNAHMTDEEWRPFEKVQDDLYSDVDDRLHLLIDHIDAQAAEIKRLRVALESIALNAPQTQPELWACNRNYSIADSYYTVGQLAVAILKDGTL